MSWRSAVSTYLVLGLLAGCGRAPWTGDGINPPPDGGPPTDGYVPPTDGYVPPPDRPWVPPDYRMPDFPRPPDYWWPPDIYKVDKYKWPDLPKWPDYAPYVSEQVTCQFATSTSLQTCYASTGETCSGVGSCTTWVKGMYGQKVDWKSTCGGYWTTILDGKNETAIFKCTSYISETVTCQFVGAAGTSVAGSCWSSFGSCSGVGSCKVTVSGSMGQTISWGSSCGAAAKTTVIDGMNETIAFTCGASLSETITCLFPGSKTTQSCDSIKGSCKGVTSCSVIVSGTLGEKVDWKSTCGGYFSTIVDGKSETITFPCSPTVSETVTCWFKGSNTFQQCYASTGASCQGLLGCTVTVTGQMNDVVTWKSSCGGYATTITDGKDEPASFYCAAKADGGVIIIDAGPPPPPPPWP